MAKPKHKPRRTASRGGAMSGAGPQPRAGYMKDGDSAFFTNWRPRLREARDDVRAGWADAAARTADIIQNSGFISGGIDQAIAYTVGTGLTLNAQPDAAALGWTPEAARQWARNVERKFQAWADNPLECDVRGLDSLGKLAASAFRQCFVTGEILALVKWKRIAGARYRTKIQLLSATRLSTKTQLPDIVQGVRCDVDGMPLSYIFRGLGQDLTLSVETEIRARDAAGRARVIRSFDGLPGQMRGISLMVSALRVARQFDQLADATLTASLIQAILVGTITSDTPTPDLMQALQDPAENMGGLNGFINQRTDYYNKSKIDMGRFGKIAHLAMGDKMEFHGAKHPNSTYKDFSRSLLREVARCLGLTYADMTGDYEGETYQSLMHSTAAMWLIVLYRRAFLVAPFFQQAYEAWLEEAIDLGDVDFPGGYDAFIENRTAASRALWRGRGRPLTDPLKLARAHQAWKEIGVITDEMIANEFGIDLDDLYEQLNREREMRDERGLPETVGKISTSTAADRQAQDAADAADGDNQEMEGA